MNENAHNDDLLIRYLDGELSADEKAGLEERLHTDKVLKEQLTSLQAAVQAVKQFGTRQKVQAVHAEMMKEMKSTPKAKVVSFTKTVRYVLAVAASLVVLFIGMELYQAAQLSPDKVYSEAFVDFSVSASRGSERLSQIENLYRQKKYAEVTAGLRSLNSTAKDSLLIGLSYLQTNRLNQAIGFFQPLAFSTNDYQQDAEFYLALSYLKMKAYDKALTLMEKIRNNPSHLYHEQLSGDAVEKTKKLAEK